MVGPTAHTGLFYHANMTERLGLFGPGTLPAISYSKKHIALDYPKRWNDGGGGYDNHFTGMMRNVVIVEVSLVFLKVVLLLSF